MRLSRVLAIAVAIGVAAGVTLVSPASDSSAANPCAMRAQIVYIGSYIKFQDPSDPCGGANMTFEYLPPNSTTKIFIGYYQNQQAGVTYITNSRAQIQRAKACSGTPSCPISSGWWTTSSWYTFG